MHPRTSSKRVCVPLPGDHYDNNNNNNERAITLSVYIVSRGMMMIVCICLANVVTCAWNKYETKKQIRFLIICVREGRPNNETQRNSQHAQV